MDNEKIALTLTFKDNKSLAYNKKILPIIIKYLRPMCREYKLVPELDYNGRLHYHAYLRVKPEQRIKYKCFINYWRRVHGFTDTSKITNMLGWFVYIRKDCNETYKVLPEHLAVKYRIITEKVDLSFLKHLKQMCCGHKMTKTNINQHNRIVDILRWMKTPTSEEGGSGHRPPRRGRVGAPTEEYSDEEEGQQYFNKIALINF